MGVPGTDAFGGPEMELGTSSDLGVVSVTISEPVDGTISVSPPFEVAADAIFSIRFGQKERSAVV